MELEGLGFLTLESALCFLVRCGTDPKIYLEAKRTNQLNSIPNNHSPKFAPVIHPTLKTGLQAMMTAAAAWLD